QQRGLIDDASATRLCEAYLFLRQLENRLQMFADMQTHSAPQDANARARIAAALDYPDWESLQRQLDKQRNAVSEEFANLLIPHAGGDADAAADVDTDLWQAAVDGELSAARMAAQGFEPGEAACTALAAVPRAASVRVMSARSAQRLHHLMPRLLADARASAAPTPCLQRLCRLVQAVARRSAYLALLEEQPAARQRLAELFAGSAYLAERVIVQPLLLDDVLDPRIDQLPLRRSAIAAVIADELANLDQPHAEDELERLNEARSSLAFRLGLAFRDGRADAPATARRLAALAEAVVAAVLTLARRDMADKHGRLGEGDGFAVLGYGSLGGAELGFASDLDLVFIYDAALATHMSDGPRPLEGVRWFQRLAQRIVHWLGALHHGGRLYEVDTRLRPDGSKGLLVSSVQAFAAYQRERAWSWEHQALLRARGVAGDATLLAQFDALRSEIIGRPRALAQVQHDVADMRVRWRRERDRSDATHIDLKQGRGALLDLEFFLQGLVLAHAAQFPALLAGHNAPAWLSACRDAGLLSANAVMQLGAAHAQLMDMALTCTLDARPRVVPRKPAIEAMCVRISAAAHAEGFDFG
ncbi:MAG: glutamine-synthetase adenylyltransferase, partial [Xanthomonadales bacterium]|nr:glutamine-synthetase adenylyltransferase [Xanthomonadales bacterium]